MEYTYTKSVSYQELVDLVNLGLKGAGTYWLDDLEFEHETNQEDWGKGILSGGKVRVHDAIEDEWLILDLDKILNGLSLTAKTDLANYDMYDAERVLQRAVFGKEIYG